MSKELLRILDVASGAFSSISIEAAKALDGVIWRLTKQMMGEVEEAYKPELLLESLRNRALFIHEKVERLLDELEKAGRRVKA